MKNLLAKKAEKTSLKFSSNPKIEMTALRVLSSTDGSLVGRVEVVDSKMYRYIVPHASKEQ